MSSSHPYDASLKHVLLAVLTVLIDHSLKRVKPRDASALKKHFDNVAKDTLCTIIHCIHIAHHGLPSYLTMTVRWLTSSSRVLLVMAILANWTNETSDVQSETRS